MTVPWGMLTGLLSRPLIPITGTKSDEALTGSLFLSFLQDSDFIFHCL